MQAEFIEYAPILIVVLGFLFQYKFFVTPAQLKDVLEEKLKNYVLKETHNIVIGGMKEDVTEIKKDIAAIRAQNAEMYNKIMSLR